MGKDSDLKILCQKLDKIASLEDFRNSQLVDLNSNLEAISNNLAEITDTQDKNLSEISLDAYNELPKIADNLKIICDRICSYTSTAMDC